MLRYEYKYIVPNEQLGRLKQLFSPYLELDGHAAKSGGEYTVRSIYFDTPQMECYQQKIEGVKYRDKVRLRGYDEGSPGATVFFEIKKKMGGPLLKHRSALMFESANRLLENSQPLETIDFGDKGGGKARENASRFLYNLHARKMQPVVTVIYDREPFHALARDKDNNLRITFDKNLRAVAQPATSGLFDEPHIHPANKGHFILEIKFNRYLPSWVCAIVNSLGLKKTPASKYVMCIEALPDLRQLKYQLKIPAMAVSNFKKVESRPIFIPGKLAYS
ncbi:MAG: polyphosphate polymerase domain-containing protein [Lewinellaceae bacterium]|nr:polyphosphate polymerase domain-containing protein [Saprospiraceae bacterium]MCB9341658.1 polyphosphate polymerase domain-containing protein [Lewinellaceae bacterium]